MQLQVAADLNLWTQCFQIAEDILQLGLYEIVQKALVSKDPEAQKTRSLLLQHTFTFYEKLAQMFFVSKQFLFHASAILRNIFHTRQHKKNLTPEEAEKMCDVGVVAVLCVPIFEKQNQSALDLEHKKRLASMLAHSGIPTRESMLYIIETRGIVSLSASIVQKLYAVIKDEINILTVCNSLNEIFDELNKMPHLASYIIHLKHVMLEKLLLKLNNIYLSLKIDFLTTKILPESFLPWKDVEPRIANLIEQGFINIRFDYSRNVLLFADESTNPENMLRNRIVKIATALSDLVPRMIIPGKPVYKSFAEKASEAVYDNFPEKLELEQIRLMERNRIVSERRRKQEEEQQAKEQAKRTEEIERQKKEELEEQSRREIALKQQEALRLKEAQQQMRVSIAKQILADFKALAERAASRLYIQGKSIDDLTYEHIASGEITYEDYEKAQEEVTAKEKQDKHRQYKQETKRMEHLIRAIREKEAAYYTTWAIEQKKTDEKERALYLDYLRKVEQHHHEFALAQHVSITKRKDHIISYYDSVKNSYLQKYQAAKEKWLEKAVVFINQEKLKRAVKSKAKKDQESLDKEKLEKQRQVDEEKLKRDRAAAIQKRREEEIERKLEEERRYIREKTETPVGSQMYSRTSAPVPPDSKSFELRRSDQRSQKVNPKYSTASTGGVSEERSWRRAPDKPVPAPPESLSELSKPTQRYSPMFKGGLQASRKGPKSDVRQEGGWIKRKENSSVELSRDLMAPTSQVTPKSTISRFYQKDEEGYTYVSKNKRKQ